MTEPRSRIIARMLVFSLTIMSALAVATTSIAGNDIPPFLIATIFVSAGVFSSLLFAIIFTRMGPPSPHNIAFIGFRRSGKTTLLMTMLSELLLFRVSRVSATLRGKRTIRQVTEYMKRINLRRAVGRTTQRSQFPYEANITQRGLLGRSFKMSFGDFPGERSEEYVRGIEGRRNIDRRRSGEPALDEKWAPDGERPSAGKRAFAEGDEPFGEKWAFEQPFDSEQVFRPTFDDSERALNRERALGREREFDYTVVDTSLFDQEFFRWILECDTLVFIVDVAKYLRDRARHQTQPQQHGLMNTNYIVEVCQAYMRTWLYIVDARHEGGETKEPIVVLAFTKSDLFDVESQGSDHQSLEATMATLGFEEPLPNVREISHSMFEKGRQECEKDFGELIQFFEGHSKVFHLVYTSSLALMDGQRLGVERLFNAVLPVSFQHWPRPKES